MSEGSAPQILSLKEKYTFFSNFVMIGLCNFSVNSQFDVISLVPAPAETDYLQV